MARQTEVRKIQIKVDTQGDKQLREIAKNLGGITREVKTVSGVLQKFNTIFNTVMGASVLGVGVKNLMDMADSYQLLSNRIGVLTGGTEDVTKIMDQLTVTANRTKNSIEDTATVFSRLLATTKEFGVGAKEVMILTEALQNTFRISGANQEEATGSTIQFTQALSLARLQGQEFRSVMLGNVTYAELLAKSLGKTRGELQKMAESGQLTNEKIMKPLVDSFIQLRDKSDKLGQTMQQSVTVAMNNLKNKIGQLAIEYDVSGKFAKGIVWVTDRLELFGVVALGLAVMQIPKLITSLSALLLVLARFTIANPVIAVLTAIGIGMTFVFDSVEEVVNTFKDLVHMVSGPVLTSLTKFKDFMFQFKNLNPQDAAWIKGLHDTAKALDEWSLSRNAVIDTSKKDQDELNKNLDSFKKMLEKITGALDTRSGKELFKEELAGINSELTRGVISLDSYYTKLQEIKIDKLERDWQQGRVSLEQFNKSVLDTRINQLTRDLNQGKISVDQFRQSLNSIEIDELNNRLVAGTITLQQFNQEMLKFRTDALNWDTWASSIKVGITDYLESIGSVGQGIAGVTKRAFDNLSDAILEMTKKGKYDFASFTQAVLDDIARIIIQAKIIAPIAKGILNYGAATAGAGYTTGDFGPVTTGNMAAKGAYFNNGASYFAKGGVVDSPTAFSFGIGKRGVMGEAGPEAILPLSRGSGGELGVKAQVTPVVVNIINQSGAQVDQKETSGPNGEKILEVLITSKVKEGMSNGTFDKTFQQLYGLRRLGY